MNRFDTVALPVALAKRLEDAKRVALTTIRTNRNAPYAMKSLISAGEVEAICLTYDLDFNAKLKLWNAIGLEVGIQ